jgi:DNA repair protein RecN (Recombination protein N)
VRGFDVDLPVTFHFSLFTCHSLMMLVQLTISNFAIIGHLEIQFKPGLNILSGETGAGKSIIINAVNLILGGRASAELIRSGADEARVEALFHVPLPSPVSLLLEEMDIPFHGDLLIKRHLSREGRNRIVINSSMATLQMLSRLGQMMISISGQHEHQLLLKPDNHLALLDDFAGLADERGSLSDAFKEHQALKEQRDALKREIREKEERQDLARFQKEEIEKAALQPGEDKALEVEKKRLLYAEKLMEEVREAYGTLYEKDNSVLSSLAQCLRRLERGADLEARLKATVKALASAKAEIEESAMELRELQRGIVMDPRRLEEVEERLQLIHKLKRKYGTSIEEIIQFKDRLAEMMDNLDQRKEELGRMESGIEEAEESLVSKAALLSRKRRQAARSFENSLKEELALLSLGGTRFEVQFQDPSESLKAGREELMRKLKAEGLDRVEFMLSPNVGEDLKPLSRIASGGELSRIMLAMKTILARSSSVETIVFDEVDSGIGGAAAEIVGDKLRSLAGYHQILCITHLPQIASKGMTHFMVEKQVVEGRTRTVISELGFEERVKEIARLLGGKKVSQKAVAHAKEMLSN